MDLDKAELM